MERMGSPPQIRGTCMEMCPEGELLLRQREGLLHRFEIVEGSKGKRPLADPLKTVKCFARPAAGMPPAAPSDLRPKEVLLNTVKYLMNLCNDASNAWEVFEFVTDRLRAIRQEMTILRVPPEYCLILLQPMMRFHIVYGYILSNHSRYDNTLNLAHLNECLHKCLDCLEVCPSTCDICVQHILNIYVSMNLNNPESVIRIIDKMPNQKIDLKLLNCWSQKNFIRVFHLAAKLEVIPKIAIYSLLIKIRDECLKNICIGFNSVNSKFSIKRLACMFSYNTVEDVKKHLTRLGISFNEDFAFFNCKDLIQNPGSPVNYRWWAIDSEHCLKSPRDLLLGNFACDCHKS